MKNLFIIIIFFLISITNYSQDRMYVSAENGLNIKEKPSFTSNKIRHLPNNTMVMISKKTGIKLTLKDNSKEINGEWIKIYSFDENNRQGYVFDGFLTFDKPEIWYADKSAYYKTYSHENFKKGTYNQKSSLKKYLDLSLPIVENNSNSIEIGNDLNFIKINNTPVVLFDSHNIEKLKPIGKIKNTSQVKIDSTFFKEKYRDFSKPWSISFNVWNRIIINGKPYYTDYDIHDSPIIEVIKELNQKVLIIGQNTGHDSAYHLGYPEYYFLLFLNENNEVIFESKILDITIGDEFAMKEDFLETNWNEKTNNFEITLFNQYEAERKELKINWNGKEIKKL
jgi:hypothetical protein